VCTYMHICVCARAHTQLVQHNPVLVLIWLYLQQLSGLSYSSSLSSSGAQLIPAGETVPNPMMPSHNRPWDVRARETFFFRTHSQRQALMYRLCPSQRSGLYSSSLSSSGAADTCWRDSFPSL